MAPPADNPLTVPGKDRIMITCEKEPSRTVDLWEVLRGRQTFDGSREQHEQLIRQIGDELAKNYRTAQLREVSR